MNILADFIKRVDALYPADVDSEELNSLLTTIKNQGDEITGLEKMVEKLQAKVAKETAAKKRLQSRQQQRRSLLKRLKLNRKRQPEDLRKRLESKKR